MVPSLWQHLLGFHPANFGLPRPFRSRVRSRHATLQTDGQTDTAHLFIMPLPKTVGVGIIFQFQKITRVLVYAHCGLLIWHTAEILISSMCSQLAEKRETFRSRACEQSGSGKWSGAGPIIGWAGAECRGSGAMSGWVTERGVSGERKFQPLLLCSCSAHNALFRSHRCHPRRWQVLVWRHWVV